MAASSTEAAAEGTVENGGSAMKLEESRIGEDQTIDTVLLFYIYYKSGGMEDDDVSPEETHKIQKQWCTELRLGGRIRVASEGLNGTLDGTAASINNYIDRMDSRYGVGTIDWKLATYPDAACRRFTGLSVKIKDEVVALHLSDSQRSMAIEAGAGMHMTPEEFHSNLMHPPKNLVLLDTRNAYEIAIGTMKYIDADGLPVTATDPKTRSFSDFPQYVEQNHQDFSRKKVLMYCTGGVRCERASAFLRAKAPTAEVYMLTGGIQRYQEKFPHSDSFFRGKNFVYDPRVSVPSSPTTPIADQNWGWRCIFDWFSNESNVIGSCCICHSPWDSYSSPYGGSSGQTRCCYCRTLLLVCTDCKEAKVACANLRCQLCRQGKQGNTFSNV